MPQYELKHLLLLHRYIRSESDNQQLVGTANNQTDNRITLCQDTKPGLLSLNVFLLLLTRREAEHPVNIQATMFIHLPM